jgi:hypothetical protein
MSPAEASYWESAGGPIPFGECDARRWFCHLGDNVHPSNPYDLHDLHIDVDGHVTMGAAMAVGLYVVVDADERCRYIGKVTRRHPGGIRDRFWCHHAAKAEWDAVWLLPLRDDCPDALVRQLEAELIGAWQPDGNIQHTSASLRAARSAA